MNVVIIEDEQPAREKLRNSLQEYSGNIQVIAELDSVTASVKWFSTGPVPDLVFLDIQLSDGTPFQLLEHKIIISPVIFVTAYDQFILEALNHHSIDYLLKPLKKEKLFQALHKYDDLRRFFQANYTPFIDMLKAKALRKERIVARKGNHSMLIHTNDIAYFFTEHKVVFLVNREGTKFVVDENLSTLETMLSHNDFFRINRKYLVQIDAITRFRQHGKGRIEVELVQSPSEEVIISQENAQKFRNWVNR